MKTIIVPTDFSGAAETALDYAAHLAKAINGSILLLHVYQVPISMNEVPVMVVSANELRTNAENMLINTRDTFIQKNTGIDIQTESRLGDIADEINDVCEGKDVFAIIVGKRGMTGMERILFGSTALSIIKNCSAPVIAVPQSATAREVKNIALAVDLFDDPGFPKQQIASIVQSFKAPLHVIHVKEKKEEDATVQLNSILKELSPTYHIIYDHKFAHGIADYVQLHNIDLLMIVPHKHSLMERLFVKAHTTELVAEVDIPIMSVRG